MNLELDAFEELPASVVSCSSTVNVWSFLEQEMKKKEDITPKRVI